MASPQIEDGYTKIANELLEALYRFNATGSQFRVMLFLIRNIYGYGLKGRCLETSKIINGTGMNKSQCIRTLNELKVANMIIGRCEETKRGITYRIQKNYKLWSKVKQKVAAKRPKGRCEETKRSLRRDQSEVSTSSIKEILKESIKEMSEIEIPDQGSPFPENLPNRISLKLSKLLFSLMLKNNEKAKKPNFEKWAEHIEKLIRIDKRTPAEIENVIRWTQQDDFEMSNILSTQKLRKRFDQLWLKSNKENKKNEPLPISKITKAGDMDIYDN